MAEIRLMTIRYKGVCQFIFLVTYDENPWSTCEAHLIYVETTKNINKDHLYDYSYIFEIGTTSIL